MVIMLKNFRVKGYKNFKDEISIDFSNVGNYQFNNDCIYNGLISKMLIFGQNASGKTNLGKALLDIKDMLICYGEFSSKEESILNADTTNKYVSFKYIFQFGRDEVEYNYKKTDNSDLVYEELKINNELIYWIDFIKNEYNVDNLSKIKAETVVIDRYLQNVLGQNNFISFKSLPFLRWIYNNSSFKRDSIVVKLFKFVSKMHMVSSTSALSITETDLQRYYEFLFRSNKVKDLENFLNEIGIECKLVLEELPDNKYDLYFDYKKLVPFYSNASSGTKVAFDLFMRYFLTFSNKKSLIFLDGFDIFCHYEMSEKIVRLFKKFFPETQVVFTSHNTNLISNHILRPDCLYILPKADLYLSYKNVHE